MAGAVDWSTLTLPGAFIVGFVVACAVVVKLVGHLRDRG